MPPMDWLAIAVWGLIATAWMTTLLEGAQLLGYTRLSLPFLFGTFVTGDRRKAMIVGYGLYLVGGWLFAFLYALAFETAGRSTWWEGMLLGCGHGLFLTGVFLPSLPYVHPRIASEFDGPTDRRRLEPPGAFGLNYGGMTPLATIAAQTGFGLIMAVCYT